MAKVRKSRIAAQLLILGGLCSVAIAAEQPQPPTLRLPDTVAPTSYRAELTLNTDQDHFQGFIAIKVDVKEPVPLIWLNGTGLSIENASLKTGEKTMPAKAVPGGTDFVGLQFDSAVPAGAAEIDIRYTGTVRLQDSSGIFRMEENGNRYLFTQFESTDARAAFPCFDEPSYKVPWQLTLNVPQHVSAVSNTPELKHETRGDRQVITFEQTEPLPSYLIAFAVGPFDFVNAGTAGVHHIPVRIVTPKGHAEDAKYAAEVTATIIDHLENYFGIPFPFKKSDQVAIPSTFGFGAMENAGMVTYAQTILLANPARDTITRQRECASVEAHELAHQWFGDLVTTAWWNDIWLNEAFATWMEQKILAEWKPEWGTRVEDVDSKLQAEGEDSLISARKIRQPIESKNDISNAFDAITYQKGAAVIGMFEHWVGSPEFRKGVQAYLKKYSWSNATAPEFLDTVSEASGKPITQPFSTFLNQAGVPLVSVALDCNQGSPILHMQQQRFLPLGSKGSADQLWQIPVCVTDGTGDTGHNECTLMTQAKQDWTLKATGCPAWVDGNDNALGYYRVEYSEHLLGTLTSGNVEQRLNAPERVDFMGDAEALSNAGKLSAADALGLVETFHADPEHYVVQNALNLALDPREHLVPPELMPNYQRFLRKNFQKRARDIGWIPQQGESDNIRLLRPTLLRIVATYAGDQELAKQGQDLANKWLENHSSVDASIVTAVLQTAAFYGDKNLVERFIADFKKTSDRQEQQRIIRAMISFRDPDAIKTAMDAVLSGKIPFIQGGGYLLVFMGQTSANTRKLAFDFVKQHFQEIAAKRPTGGGFDFGSLLPRVGDSYCSAEARDQLKSFFEPRVSQFTGAPRALSQVLEGINVCIAEKAAQEPSVVAFLKKY